MSGVIGGAPTPRTVSTLSDDTNRAVARLQDMLGRVQSLNDRINGGTPREASLNPAPEPQPSIRRHVDAMHDLIGNIEGELEAIDARL